jgi:hypothetical protein
MADQMTKPEPNTAGVLVWLAIFAIAVAFIWTLLIVVVVGMVLLT